MEAQLQPARDRFAGLDEEGQTRFRDRLTAFVSLHAFLSQLIPYADGELERLSAFGHALLPHLKPASEGTQVHIGEDVDLEYYRLQRVSSGAIHLSDGEAAYVSSPTEVGTGDPEEEKVPLSEIIERLNDRFGTDFTNEDRLFFEQVTAHAVNHEAVRRMALVNPLEKFMLGIRPEIRKLMMERMVGNDALVTRYLDDADFREIVATGLAEAIYVAVTRAQPALPMDA